MSQSFHAATSIPHYTYKAGDRGEDFARRARADKISKVLAELDYCALVVGVPRLAGEAGVRFFANMTVAQMRALYQAAGVRPGSETTVRGIVEAIRGRS